MLKTILLLLIPVFLSAQKANTVVDESCGLLGLEMGGEVLLSMKYMSIKNLYWGEKEIYEVTNVSGQKSIFNTETRVLTGFNFDSIGEFKDVYFPIAASGKGISSEDFETNYLQNGEPFKIIEKSGNMRTTYVDSYAAYAHVSKFENASLKKEIYAPVVIKGKWGVVNSKGKLILDAEYDEIIGVLGDFNQIVVCVKNGKVKMLNCLLEEINPSDMALLHYASFSNSVVLFVANESNSGQISVLNSLGDLVCDIPYNMETINKKETYTEISYVGDYEFLVVENNNLWSAVLLFEPEKGEVISGKASREEVEKAMEEYAMGNN